MAKLESLFDKVWVSKYSKSLNYNQGMLQIASELKLSESATNALLDKTLVPGGSIIYGLLNTEKLVSLSNCYVIDSPEDSIDGINATINEMDNICKRRGGVGVDLSTLRPNGAKVNNSSNTSTGIVGVMHKINSSIEYISQNGRRGALMVTLNYLHPDIFEFIKSKAKVGVLNNMNISVQINGRDFFDAINNKKDIILRWPLNLLDDRNYVVAKHTQYNKLLPSDVLREPIYDKNNNIVGFTNITGGYIKRVSAEEYLNTLIDCMHDYSEPGILWKDTYISESIADNYGLETITTNPCGEIGLNAYDSCRLSAINLYNCVDNPFTKDAKLNKAKLGAATAAGVELLNKVIDNELNRLKSFTDSRKLWDKVIDSTLKGRRLGLGIMGLADVFAALNITYGSKESIELASEIQSLIAYCAYKESAEGKYNKLSIKLSLKNEKKSGFMSRMIKEYHENFIDRANIQLLTAAPTGTLAILAGVSSGIEPVFSVFYYRDVILDEATLDTINKDDIIIVDGVKKIRQIVIHPKFIEWYSIINNINYDAAYEILSKMTPEELNNLIVISPYNKSTAYDINPVDKVVMQGSIQKWIDHSISVTHNLKKDATKKEVLDLVMASYNNGCKGITIYRDGSRGNVLTTTLDTNKTEWSSGSYKRPKRLSGKLLRFMNNNEPCIAIITLRDNKPYELFCGNDTIARNIPKNINECYVDKVIDWNGDKIYEVLYTDDSNTLINLGDVSQMIDRELQNYGRLISSMLRNNIKLEHIYKVIEYLKFDNDTINSWKRGVMRALSLFMKDSTNYEKCPKCGGKIIFENGCKHCSSCGYSYCG